MAKKILIIRLDFIGDLIVTTGLLEKIKESNPNAQMHVLTNYYNAQVVEGNPFITQQHIFHYVRRFSRNPVKSFWWSLYQRIKLIWTLRRANFDLVIVPNSRMDRRAIQIIKLIAPKDARYRTKKTYFNDDNPEHVKTKPLIHEALTGFKLLPEIHEPLLDELRLSVYPTAKLVEKWQHNYPSNGYKRVGLFISQKAQDRAFAQKKWQEVAIALKDEFQVFIYSNDSSHFSHGWNEINGLHFPETDNLAELMASMTLLHYVICTDSAPLHFCSAMNIPVVGLFENRIEKLKRWHPLNVKYEIVFNERYVDSISVDQVLTAFSKLSTISE